MKKRIISTLCSMSMIIGLSLCPISDAVASDGNEIQIVESIDGSILTTNDSSSGSTNTGIERGKHLMDGDCSITKAGKGRIYVYASTTANHTVDYVSTIIYVDRYNEEDKAWDQIDFWQVEDQDTYYVATSKTMKVDSGYYYRVHADHAAGMDKELPYDEAISVTDGIFVN